ncbi:PsbP-related protein [Sporomusa aerivorans]|uniref:PsbP-related protein n=1 Tax=Sporomusa aerivorans TaxID=204936 RepID=UPI00352B9FC1
MKQLYLVLLTVILILSSACSSDKVERNASNSIQLSQTYKNEAEGFVFKYPQEWQTKESATMTEIIKIQSPDGNAKLSVMKIVTNPFGILTEDQAAVENAVNQMHKFIALKDTKLGDIPTRELVYQTNGLKGDDISKNYWYVFGGDVYQIICSFKMSERERYEPMMNAMMESYTITRSANDLNKTSSVNSALTAREAKELLQNWVDTHQFPSSVSIMDGDGNTHKRSGSDAEYYVFQLQGLHRIYDILVDTKTRELFVHDTGKPEALEPWYQKYIAPYANANDNNNKGTGNSIDKNFEWVEKPRANNGNIIGKIRNISGGDRRKISVTFLLYDYKGNQIGTAIDINPMLKSGTVWSFTAQVQNAKVTNFELAEINYQ